MLKYAYYKLLKILFIAPLSCLRFDGVEVIKHNCTCITPADQTELHGSVESGGAAAADSDDSDDIIVSPSRPLRSREVLIL